MNIGKACAICNDINHCGLSDDEKGLAIYTMMNMETHNSITKKTLLDIIKYLFQLCFDVEKMENIRNADG